MKSVLRSRRISISSFLLLSLIAGLCADGAAADDGPKPIRALMVTGGCCHDYEAQKKILSEGISARAKWSGPSCMKEKTAQLS